MEQKYADIIIDISHENLDKTYQYAIPKELWDKAVIGALAVVPFGKGNRQIKGYIVDITTAPKLKVEQIKPISEIVNDALIIESQLIHLAYWIKDTFGSTMNDALKTVIPVKKQIKAKEKKTIRLGVTVEEAKDYLVECKRKNNKGRVRLLEELILQEELEFEIVTGKLNIARTTISDLEKLGIITTDVEKLYRNPIRKLELQKKNIELTTQQRLIADDIIKEYQEGIRKTYLIHGVTGSGKTEVYMEIISEVIKEGKEVIMLIPEIALTYQTVMRFYKRFGNRISIMNSRLSQGERYDQYLRAKNKDIDIMIGPRSALFTPFENLGLIIIDEEHEGSYKSESPPKYHGREVAIKRASLSGASVVLGSATPSLESYKKAMEGEYRLYSLSSRIGKAELPKIWIEDLREELKNKNKTIFSVKLRELIEDRLSKNQQIMLFINKRGYAGFVSCRSCGHVMKCPHCDISLTYHKSGNLICHYCGHEELMPGKCPACGSKYIAAFGTGTQKVEEMVKKEFPQARVLRMDMDTTKNKDGHEKILAAFSNHEADILVGTQMIVKGHDFPMVTLVGILAADLSLYAGDYRASERTFQLLVQASGRAGRSSLPGEVVIQTYQPEHYSITTASVGDYESFYEKEYAYRDLLMYPPAAHILAILVASKDENKAEEMARQIGEAAKQWVILHLESKSTFIIGPAAAQLARVNDIYRYVIYIKRKEYNGLVQMKNYLEEVMNGMELTKDCMTQFDFNPMNSY
ncbi:MAG: hypothetical protein K0R92_1188 [Lachnospiraceae bacterium]|jgi:primosomal protein N' (replication factor Y)|nr:hypothetical protein [Lachnospiraceae bacterium]